MIRPCVVSPVFPEPQPIRDSGERISTDFVKGTLALPLLYPPPPKNLRGEGKDLYTPWKNTAPTFLISKCRLQRQQCATAQQIHSLRTGADTRSHMQRPGKQNIPLWGSQLLPKWLNRVERRMLKSWQHATRQHLTPKWKSFRVNTLCKCLCATEDIYKVDPQLRPNYTMGKKESSSL